jgi:hypothetical protein
MRKYGLCEVSSGQTDTSGTALRGDDEFGGMQGAESCVTPETVVNFGLGAHEVNVDAA